MGAIMKALSPQSSHAAKKAGLWEEITDRIEGCLYASMLEDVDAWLIMIDHKVPRAWKEQAAELVEKKRDELNAETNIGDIIRDRFDF